MIVAVVAGVFVGLIMLLFAVVCASSWGRRTLPEWFLEHGFLASIGLIGVLGSIVVSKIVGADRWSLFAVQVVTAMATMLIIGWPLRHRLRAM